ncbi:PREDICTED: chromosome partition protein Smc-like [Cyphomyrmex costatus]|uniref:chromosome partition protein Smc-like n=1 Tax=Cyphomyrmex costatus TaxID=456900 RepID=UPI0008523B08|nr:PREDICTED: chromosome partition protein Smc-like [Cyphomyrmex costatus]
MEKSASSQMNPEDIENPGSHVKSYIEQFTALKKLVERSDREIQYWKNQKSKLLESNSSIGMNFDKLMQNVSYMEDKISENTRIYITKKQELKDLQIARTNMLYKQWNNCLLETGRYADSFCQWMTNYSRDYLTKEISSHQEECEKVRTELEILKQEVENMKTECNADYTEANMDDHDNLSNLNSAISDMKSSNNNLIKHIKMEEDELNKIQNKIKQCKVKLNRN